MASGPATENRFLTAPIGRLFLSNAVPMILLMSMGGLLNVVDALFLGHFVGPEALAAVSISFPMVMITIALASLVSGGMSSLLARHLGAQDRLAAGAVFARAHGLSLCVALGLIAAFVIWGASGLRQMSDAQGKTAGMAYSYLLILIAGTPVQFLLGLHADALRNEGRAGLMALLSVAVTLANIVLNYGLIVGQGLGVAGSAWGTVLAQGLGLGLLLTLRLRDDRLLSLSVLAHNRWYGGWRPILLLGLPVSLSFIGMALVSACVIATLKLTAAEGYAGVIAAYGIVTRIFGLAFMPIMAIALATQSIVGNNVGAGHFRRSDAALRLALVTAFLYCLTCELALYATRKHIGAVFVADAAVAAQVAMILRPMLTLYLFAGPVLVLALYFQAIGQPGRTAVITLVKPFMLSPVLIVTCATLSGPAALWFAFPLADGLTLLLVAVLVVAHRVKDPGKAGFGLARPG
jgi:putative MATE family efflux protein